MVPDEPQNVENFYFTNSGFSFLIARSYILVLLTLADASSAWLTNTYSLMLCWLKTF